MCYLILKTVALHCSSIEIYNVMVTLSPIPSHTYTHCICIALKCSILIVMFKFVMTQFKVLKVPLLTRFKFVNKHTHARTQSTHIQKLQGMTLISVDRISCIETIYVFWLLFTSLLLEMHIVCASL